MKPYAFLALVVALTGFVAVISAVEAPRKPSSKEKAYILPRVEDMASPAKPLQF